jgi:hypothetical protein
MITPRQVSLTETQQQQFSTNAAGGAVVNWSVDGIANGNSTVGTITTGGLYTAPTNPSTHTVTGVNSGNSGLSVSAAVAVSDLRGVFTYHNDLARTGQNLQEYALTPATVSGGNFGKRWSCTLDGLVQAQPLYVANLAIAGGVHNVLIVATMHDSVYAFDADNGSCTPYWQRTFLSTGVTTVATTSCPDTPVEYGVFGTPVIDPTTDILYLVANTTENGGSSYVQRLHGLNLSNGQDASPAQAISASVSGTGDGGTSVSFNPRNEGQRAGLALVDGNVVIGWGSKCDNSTVYPWHGWVMSYYTNPIAQAAAYTVTPNGIEGGIWMSAGAPAVDAENSMFLSTGNGTFDAPASTPPAPNDDFSMSFLNLNPTTLGVQDFYTPSNWSAWNTADLDISAGGITMLPDGTGPSGHPNEMVGTDKGGHIWLIDRSNMSGYVAGADNTVQYLTLPGALSFSIHGGPAYWNGNVYVALVNSNVLALQLTGGLIPHSGGTAIAASKSTETYSYPTPTPTISASPAGNAILWVLDNNANGSGVNGSGPSGPAILRAYDATNLGNTLYSSANSSSDAAGTAAKFISPVVANGHVYVVGWSTLTVYGLAP